MPSPLVMYPRELVFGLPPDDRRRGVIEMVAKNHGLPLHEKDGRLHVTIASPQQAYQFGQFCGRVFQEMKVTQTPLPDAPSAGDQPDVDV